MSPVQFCFRKGVSKTDALSFFKESVCISIDTISIVQTAILNLSKESDFISYDILIEKLKNS